MLPFSALFYGKNLLFIQNSYISQGKMTPPQKTDETLSIFNVRWRQNIIGCSVTSVISVKIFCLLVI